MNATILFLIPFMIATIAVCYSVVLTEPGQILSGWWNWLYERKMFKNDIRAEHGAEYHPLFKILVQCEKCVAGQWALWLYSFVLYKLYVTCKWYEIAAIHLYCIAVTIMFAVILKKIIIKCLK